jgi:hypothetical protein
VRGFSRSGVLRPDYGDLSSATCDKMLDGHSCGSNIVEGHMIGVAIEDTLAQKH